MSRSPYTDKVILTKKHSGKRTHKVQAFVLHHMAAVWTGERCATYLRDTPSRQASANYYIGYGGDVVLGVEESNRAWTSSSGWADNRAITYELANSKMGHPWSVSDATIQKVIVMLAEQHKRYGLKKASYTGDTKGTIWRHDFFAKTNCPGPYLGGKLAYMAREINKILDGGGNQVKEGWVKNNTGWWYRNADDSYPKDQWLKINGTWYLFDKRGYMLTGWQKVKGTWYYMSGSGAMQTGWVKLHDYWYYLNPNGSMAIGWKRLGDEWYYLYSNGQMATGLIEVAGKNYYLQRNGVLITDNIVKLEANKHGHLK